MKSEEAITGNTWKVDYMRFHEFGHDLATTILGPWTENDAVAIGAHMPQSDADMFIKCEVPAPKLPIVLLQHGLK